jgi:hypothetical protein
MHTQQGIILFSFFCFPCFLRPIASKMPAASEAVPIAIAAQ